MLPAAMSQLSRTFGRLTRRAAIDTAVARSTAPALSVNVPRAQTGWAVASWSVAHAKAYGITNVRYAGYEWLAAGGRGWEHDSRAPGHGVALS